MASKALPLWPVHRSVPTAFPSPDTLILTLLPEMRLCLHTTPVPPLPGRPSGPYLQALSASDFTSLP